MCTQRPPTALAACTVATVACSGPISVANALPLQVQLPSKNASCANSGGALGAAGAAAAAGFAMGFAAAGFAASAANKDGQKDSAAKAAATMCLRIRISPVV